MKTPVGSQSQRVLRATPSRSVRRQLFGEDTDLHNAEVLMTLSNNGNEWVINQQATEHLEQTF